LPSNTNAASIDAVGEIGTVTSAAVTGAAVPEPTTMFLMGAGLVGLFVGRRAVRKS
jgi:hypothetical protein